MLLNRISMRVNVIATLAIMGLLSLGVAVMAGRIYRDHALDNERAAVSERLRVSVGVIQKRLHREAETIGVSLAASLSTTVPQGRSEQQVFSWLDRAATPYISTEASVAAVGLALYDQALQPLARRSLSTAHDGWFAGCEQIRTPLARRKSETLSGIAIGGFCFADQHLYYTVFVRIKSSSALYLQVVLDAATHLQPVANVLGLPLRVLHVNGTAIFQSADWPNDDVLNESLLASIPLEQYANPVAMLQIAKDERNFYAQLERIRTAVFFATVAVTLLFILIAVAFLERTVFSPLRHLIEQLRSLHRDESQLGNRVAGAGNAETVQLSGSFNEMTDRLEGLYERLERMAFTDALTQLPNRSFFYECLEDAIADAQRDNRAFALFIMDLNRFKEINDALGHNVGDLLLQQVAVRLRDKLRESDTIARMGGDEFAVLMPSVTSKQADTAARMLLQSLRSPFIIESHHLDIGTSIGIAMYPDHGVDLHTLIQRADVAMYAAKQNGCGHMFYDTEMDRHHQAQLTLMGELRQAVEQEQFELYYQPKIGLKANRVVGLEALVRWRHPSGQLIMPETFIPLLEQTGLIRNLTTWVTQEALRMGGDLRGRGFDLPIAVNISARDLQNHNLAEELAENLAVHQATAEWLELEITESAVMADIVGAQDLLTQLSNTGFKIVIDDFGTGYSSLAYLKRLPVHAVKIDKSFVMGMARDENDAAIVYTSIDLTHNLGLQVVAEGVDDEGVLIRLRSRGCDAVQGMFLSRPLSSEELTDWLAKSIWGISDKLARRG